MWNVTPKREMKDMCGGPARGVAGLVLVLVASPMFCYELGYPDPAQLSVNNVKLQRASPSPRLFISKSNIIPVVYSGNSNNSSRTSTSTLHLHISV